MKLATIAAHKADPKLPRYCWEIDENLPLDRFISYAVMRLREGGIDTFESCDGGPRHASPEPKVRFWGNSAMGFRRSRSRTTMVCRCVRSADTGLSRTGS